MAAHNILTGITACLRKIAGISGGFYRHITNFRRLKRWLLNIAAGLATFAIVIFAALVVWVCGGPRSLKYMTPYMEYALSPPTSHYRVKIEDSEMRWQGFSHPLGLVAKNVSVTDDNGAVLAYFPEIGVSAYIYKLIMGTFEVKSLEFRHPNITVTQRPDGSLSLGTSPGTGNERSMQAGNSLPSLLALLVSENGDSSIRNIKSVKITNAMLMVNNPVSGTILQSPDASLEISRKPGKAQAEFSIPLVFEDKKATISGDFSLDRKNNQVTADVRYHAIPSQALQRLLPQIPREGAMAMDASGTLKLLCDFDGNVEQLGFSLESGLGSIAFPGQFEQPLHIKSIKLTGSITDHLNTLNVTYGKLSLIGSNGKTSDLSFNGRGQKIGNEYALDGNAETGNVPVNDVHLFWAKGLSPHSRRWVLGHVKDGTVAKASVEAHFKPGEIRLKDTPEKAVTAKIAVKNTSIRYLPTHPEVKDINAVVTFTGRSMDATVTGAKYLNESRITRASVRMPDLYPADVRMFVTFDMEAKARDVATFLALPDINRASALNITQDIQGDISGNARLDFIAFSEDESHSSNAVNYAVKAVIANGAQEHFLEKYAIENADMQLELDNTGIKANGAARINHLPMQITLKSSFGKNISTEYAVKCTMPSGMTPRFGLPALDFASGSIGVNASFVESERMDKSAAELDISNMMITLPQHGFSKKSGIPATLSLKTSRLANGNTALEDFILKSEGVFISGNAEFDKRTAGFASVNLDKMLFGKNDLDSMRYTRTASGFTLLARGKAMDATPYLDKPDKSSEDAYTLDIKAGRLVLGNNREISDASITADCSTLCHHVNAQARLSDGSAFSYIIQDSHVNAKSSNAGEVLRLLGAIDTVAGGNMLLEGHYNGDRIEGLFTITDYTLKHAPVLTRILTIASLTGILDTLTGNGIYFSKLSAPFTWKNGIIAVREAKTHGPALGLTADGTLNLNSSEINASGVIVPSYTMNSLISNVPLIGDMLVGGTGKGIIGINYSVSGKTSDPSVSVNPLSALTPGFLRGVFGIFDKPAPDIDTMAAKAKNEPEKPVGKPRDSTLPSLQLLDQ